MSEPSPDLANSQYVPTKISFFFRHKKKICHFLTIYFLILFALPGFISLANNLFIKPPICNYLNIFIYLSIILSFFVFKSIETRIMNCTVVSLYYSYQIIMYFSLKEIYIPRSLFAAGFPLIMAFLFAPALFIKLLFNLTEKMTAYIKHLYVRITISSLIKIAVVAGAAFIVWIMFVVAYELSINSRC